MLRTCLKCGRPNAEAGTDELAECPWCGAIYSRVEATVARSRQAAGAGVLSEDAAATRAALSRERYRAGTAAAAELRRSRPLSSKVKMWAGIAVGAWIIASVAIAALIPDSPIEPAVPRQAKQARVVEGPSAPAACTADDAACIGQRELGASSGPCRRAVEAQLAYRHEWTDAWYEEKFSRVMWYEPTSSVIYHGNKLQGQNGFGAWKKLTYFCAWDIAGKRVLKAGVTE